MDSLKEIEKIEENLKNYRSDKHEKQFKKYYCLIKEILIPFFPIEYNEKKYKLEKVMDIISELKKDFANETENIDFKVKKIKENLATSIFYYDDKVYFRYDKTLNFGYKISLHNEIIYDTKVLSPVNDKAVSLYKKLFNNIKKSDESDYDLLMSNNLEFNTLNKLIIELSIISYIISTMYNPNMKIQSNLEDLISNILAHFHDMISETYEGKTITEAVIIENTILLDAKNTNSEMNSSAKCVCVDKDNRYFKYVKKLHQRNFNPIINQNSSFVRITVDGNIISYNDLLSEKHKIDENNITPYQFSAFSNTSHFKLKDATKCLGLLVNENCEILMYINKDLSFVFSKNRWHYIKFENFKNFFLKKLNPSQYFKNAKDDKIIKKLYNTILDCSFMKKGACIGVMTEENYKKFLEENIDIKNKKEKLQVWNLLNDNEYSKYIKKLSEKKEEYDDNRNKKTILLQRLIKNSTFNRIDRVLFSELLALDGAAILVLSKNNSWKIKCVGAIIDPEYQVESGGRSAAAKSLAKYGLGIKVSTDSGVTIFADSKDEEIFRLF
mgnify:CR=1 FL=1